MKRTVALILAFVFIFSFCACGKKNVTSNADLNSQPTAEFKAPEGYASIVLLTINPQIKLYIDINGKVLAVEPINDDAKGISDKITVQKGSIESVIGSIITAVNGGGFLKENNEVDFEVIEIKEKEVNAEQILNYFKESAEYAFKALNKAVEIKVSVSENADKTGDTASQTAGAENTSSASNTPASSAGAGSSAKPAGTTESHAHSYEAATCTAPETCSCGATRGAPLGHSFSNGSCARCDIKDPNVKYESVNDKKCTWKHIFVIGDTLYDMNLHLSAEEMFFTCGFGEEISADSPEAEYAIVVDGKYYYVGKGEGDHLLSVEEYENTVTVTDKDGNALVLLRTDENTLKIISSSKTFGSDKIGKIQVGGSFSAS